MHVKGQLLIGSADDLTASCDGHDFTRCIFFFTDQGGFEPRGRYEGCYFCAPHIDSTPIHLRRPVEN